MTAMEHAVGDKTVALSEPALHWRIRGHSATDSADNDGRTTRQYVGQCIVRSWSMREGKLSMLVKQAAERPCDGMASNLLEPTGSGHYANRSRVTHTPLDKQLTGTRHEKEEKCKVSTALASQCTQRLGRGGG
jgi:hypothetical protein